MLRALFPGSWSSGCLSRRLAGCRGAAPVCLLPACLWLAGASATAWGQAAALDAQAMIEALRPPAAAASAAPAGTSAGTTRNLTVVARAVEAAHAPVLAPAPAASGASTAAPGGLAVPAAAAAPTPAATAAAPSLSLTLSFASNSHELKPENGRVLGHLVAALLSPELRGQRYLIEGHTDASGSAPANLRLSQQRAEEVRQYLVALGVPAGRLRATGRGAQDLANPLHPRAAENRRVRVALLP